MITNITEINERSDYIISLIKKCRDDVNRKILILSDRLDHLDYMLNKVKELDIGSSDKYIGGMKQEKLDIAEQADMIFSTYSMSSEALDISSLNTIILSTSRKNVEQSVGRILRNQKGNYLSQPLIIDIVDDIKTFVVQGYNRKSYYKKITKVENIVNFKNGKKTIEEKKENIIFIDSDSE
jgi:superfamily II DNA or RNA helicase